MIKIKNLKTNAVYPYHTLSYVTLKEYLESEDYKVMGDPEEVAEALAKELKIDAQINKKHE